MTIQTIQDLQDNLRQAASVLDVLHNTGEASLWDEIVRQKIIDSLRLLHKEMSSLGPPCPPKEARLMHGRMFA